MDIQEKINRKIEQDTEVNPLGIKTGEFVTLDGKGIYKILKFNEIGTKKDKDRKVTANVNMIYSDDGKKMNRLRIETFDISRLKPAFISINHYLERIENLKAMVEFVKSTMSYEEFIKYDNYGNLKK